MGVVKYREFSIFTKIFKALRSFDLPTLKKQVINFVFLLNLFFSRNKKIVLGIAPFDHKLLFLLKLLKNHCVYYHTSWAHWDRTFHPKTKKNSQKVFEAWTFFLEKKSLHIFSVTQTGKERMLKNYDLPADKITVVAHSLAPQFKEIPVLTRKKNSFIFVGRLVPQKGLEEALKYFSHHEDAVFTVIGKGELSELVKKFALENRNIFYREFVENKTELKKEFASHQFLLLNSKKKKNWEELFGMVIIEAMSQGTIPVASQHTGPCEIISNDTGYLFEEGKVSEMLDYLLHNSVNKEERSKNCIVKSHEYFPEILAHNWKAVLILPPHDRY
ncbi:glycosyltransferase family 4 protein [Salinimicrobium catena]|uniref:glycosyltransferase family 4 protein n=1 Tax=Salinimicrobium catena TaxID=390640 RepID=UPI002FE45075